MSSLPNQPTGQRKEPFWNILAFLAGVPARSLNEDVLLLCFHEFGLPLGKAELRHALDVLERKGWLRLISYRLRQGRSLLVVQLTAEGLKSWLSPQSLSCLPSGKPL